MESIRWDLEASQDNKNIYNNLKYNNASDVTLTFDIDTYGIIDLSERGTDPNKVDKINIRRDKRNYESINSQERVEFLGDSSSIEQEFVKIPSNENKYDYLPTEITQFILDLQFSVKVENLIIHNFMFRRFIIEIERSLNKFIELEYVKLENKIFFEEDWEIPQYEKLILSLNFKGITFKREMLLWKMINTMVYDRIKHMILSSSEEKVRIIKELKKKFFIKLEM